MASNEQVVQIPLERISDKAHRRLRRTDQRVVDALCHDIEERGLRSPIEVARDDQDGGYVLVAGGHRLAAMRQLGRETIGCFVVTGSRDELRMAEALENIVRGELTKLERAIHVYTVKHLWQKQHPESTHGGVRRGEGFQNLTVRNWAASVADRTGWGEKTLARSAQIGAGIDRRAAEYLSGTGIDDNQKELLALIKYSTALQREISLKIQSGDAATVAQAAALIIGEPEEEPVPRPVQELERVTKIWAKISNEAKVAFVEVLKSEGFI